MSLLGREYALRKETETTEWRESQLPIDFILIFLQPPWGCLPFPLLTIGGERRGRRGTGSEVRALLPVRQCSDGHYTFILQVASQCKGLMNYI